MNAKPTEKQQQLNEEGVRALVEGDYVLAISLLEESLFLGELNIAYLNLGRAYQKSGQCEKALEALQKVEDAPQVQNPSPAFVNAKAEQYIDEMEESCAQASTANDSVNEEVDEQPPATEEQPPATEEQSPATELSAKPDAPTPPSTAMSSQDWGIIATSAGGVLVASAVGMHLLWAEPLREDARNATAGSGIVRNISQREYIDAQDRANAVDTAALTTGVVGGIATGIGLYLWLSDEGPDRHTLQVTPGLRGTTLSYQLRF